MAFSAALRAGFCERAAGHARRTAPAACEAMGEASLRALIERGVERAASHGIVAERDVCRYLDLVLVLGVDFDVTHAWAAEILAAPHDGGPAEALFLVYAEAAARGEGGVPPWDAEALQAFPRRPVGGCVQAPAETGFVAFEIADAQGLPAEGDFALEYPDGTLEPGRFWRGRLYRSDVPKGEYAVHFPALVEARWERQRLAPGEAPGDVGLILGHVGFRAGTEVAVAVHRTSPGRGLEPCAALVVRLAGDDRRLLETQETRAGWALAEGVLPGERAAFTFTATVGRHAFSCASPLVVAPPPETPLDG